MPLVLGKHFVTLALLGWPYGVLCQPFWQGGPFRFDHFTVEKGLPTPGIIDIFRDARSFVWFYSTRDIVRFDGFEYRRYPMANQPLDLIRFGDDAQGTLYTTDGLDLFRFDAVADRFIPIPLPEPLGRKEALSFLPTTLAGPRCRFRHGDRLYEIRSPWEKPALLSDKLLTSDRFVGLVSRNGDILLSNANNGTQTSRLQRIRPDGTSTMGPGVPAMVHHIQEDADGQFWMGAWASGLWRYDSGTKQLHNFPGITQDDNAFDIGLLPEWTGEDVLWCNYGAPGLCLFNRKKEAPELMLRADEFQKQALNTTSIYIFHYDREHILWLGHHKGVSILHPRKQRIRQRYFHQPTEEYITLSVESRAPRQPEERFILFREDDIRIYDPAGKIWRTVDKAANGLREQKAGHYFRACFDADGRFWLATPTGLFQMQRTTGRLTRKVAGLAGTQWAFGAICPDKTGNVWWFDRYLRRYDTKTGRVETFTDGTDSTGLLPYEGLINIYPASAGQLWLSGWKTIVRFDPVTRKVLERLHLAVPPAAEKFNPRINRMVPEGDTVLWLTTTYGLVHLDRRSRRQTVYYPQGDSTLIYGGLGLALDRFGNIWTGDHNGIYRLDRKTGRFTTIDQRDGCASNVLYNLVTNGDRILANRFLGVVDEINPEIFQTPQPSLPVYITDILFGEERLAINPDSSVFRPYRFTARDRAISIQYTAIDFDQPHKARFEYRLEPYDRDWVHAGSNRSATYTNLEGGEYRFRVRVINADGIVSEIAAPLCFYVPKVWYRTGWFYSLCALALGGLFYAIFRYREIQRLEQEKLRLRIARDLHDDMGSTLSSISILSEAALRHLQADIDRARFGAIGERARQVMEAMGDIVWSVNPRNDTMANVLQRMKEFAVEMLEPQGIALHFEAGEAAAALNLPMEQRKDFYLLFKEAVNNAAKYSGASDVWVTVQAENGGLRLEVRDNGRGFDSATVKRGNGLWNMQRRAERMGAVFGLESAERAGTRLWVSLSL